MKKTDTLRRLRNFACALLALGTLFTVSIPSASAAEPPEFFTQIPSGGQSGSGAGQLSGVGGVAADSTTGHIFVADRNNVRISEFTAWGEFVKAWGWGVVASGPGNQPSNEVQELDVDATEGAFSLKVTGIGGGSCSSSETTSPFAFDASAAAVQAALEALCNFQVGEVAVSGPAGGPWVISFAGRYADYDVQPFEPVNSTLGGGTATATVKTLQGGANFEICVPADGDVCRDGQEGVAAGQFAAGVRIAVDSAGAVYVVDTRQPTSQRVQKFDSEGNFLLMFGGEVNKTTGEDVCTAASGDQCGTGTIGTNPGEFASANSRHSIAADPSGTIWVADKDRIQQFEPNGTFKSAIPTPEPGDSQGLAVDPVSGDLYFSFDQGSSGDSVRPNVYRLASDDGEVLDVLAVGSPWGLATDSAGNVYVIDDPVGFGPQEAEPFIVSFDSQGEVLIGAGEEFARPDQPDVLRGLATSHACNVPSDTLYVTVIGVENRNFVDAYGSQPDPSVCPAPQVPPAVTAQYARLVSTDTAVVQARINPNYWPDTTYYVQFGTEPCSAGGCDQSALSPGAKLTDKFVNGPVTTTAVSLPGLQPGTTYHYRFVAQSTGGGPVVGEEASFTTFPLPGAVKTDCSNQTFRAGRAGALPDCRAYEMVSPVDKNGSDINVLNSSISGPAEMNQSSGDGNSLSFSAQTAFGDAISAPYTSQYLASRDPAAGWSTHGISPPRETESVISFQLPRLDVQFKAFSEDLCKGWFLNETEPLLAPKAVPDYLNLYARDNCGTEGYEAISAAKPTNTLPEAYWPEIQGVSANGAHTIFRANARLTGNAPSIDQYQLYENVEGKVRLVSILPDGKPYKGGSSAGVSGDFQDGRRGVVQHAISEDGSRIFWTAESGVGGGSGELYVRIDPSPASGDEETVTVSAGPALFRAAAADGSKAIFIRGGSLYEFDVATEAETLIAGGVEGVVGTNDDASRVYFVSTQELGGESEAGQPNLYLHVAGSGGGPRFIATLGNEDISINNQTYSPIQGNPARRFARVTPDGGAVAFMSSTSLTGYDNLDSTTGLPDAEVYLYSADEDRLRCVSCNPTSARPIGRVSPGPSGFVSRIASRIPSWPNQLYASHVLSDDGSRLFFESFGGLVARDTNGVKDVYLWQQADSRSVCEDEIGGELFLEKEGGCLSLISTGESPIDSHFLDASRSGDDVFFRTGASLVGQDPGLIDIYDARVGGGFPGPAAPPAQCEGEACQPPPTPPNDPSPGSLSYSGAGNVKPVGGKANPRGKPCPKGKRKVRKGGKVRCVPKKQKPKRNSKQKRSHNRGANR